MSEFGLLSEIPEEPKRMGLLNMDPETLRAFGMSLLQGRSPHFGTNLAGAYFNAHEYRTREQQRRMQQLAERQRMEAAALEMQQRKRALTKQEAEDALAARYRGNPNAGPSLLSVDDEGYRMPSPDFDWQGYARELPSVDRDKALSLQANLAALNQKDSFTLKPNERRFQGGRLIAEGGPDLPAGMFMGPNGPQYYSEYLAGQERINAARRSQTNINLPPAQKAFEVELAKLDAKQLDDMRDSAVKAQNGLSRLGEMKRLAREGTYSGWGAEGRTGVANFFDTLGVRFDRSKLANSQEYMKHAKELTLSVLKEGVGSTNISNADLKFVNETVPQLETNPQARMNLLNYMERRLGSSVERFQSADSYARQRGGLGGFNYNPRQESGESNNLRRNETALYKARQAIKAGKDRGAVIQRMIEQGFSPEGL